ncbi:HD domain-containing protein [Streptomyces nogalater]
MTEAHTDERDVTRRTLLQRGAGRRGRRGDRARRPARRRPRPAGSGRRPARDGGRGPHPRHRGGPAHRGLRPRCQLPVALPPRAAQLCLRRAGVRPAGARYDRELAFVATVLHDLGLVEAFQTPSERFEVDGADAARRFLHRLRVPAGRVDVVWDAIALHTSAGIAARKRPEIALVSVGSALDFTGNGLDRIPADVLAEVLGNFPGWSSRRSRWTRCCRCAAPSPWAS